MCGQTGPSFAVSPATRTMPAPGSTKPALTEAQKTLASKRQELARVIEHLRSPGLSSGLLWELRKNATNLERERAEIEQAR
jgi:hypothetical protein